MLISHRNLQNSWANIFEKFEKNNHLKFTKTLDHCTLPISVSSDLLKTAILRGMGGLEHGCLLDILYFLEQVFF